MINASPTPDTSLRTRVRSMLYTSRHRAEHLWEQAILKLLRYEAKRRHSNMVSFAQRELVAMGYDPNEKDGPNRWVQDNIAELLAVFSMQGHSGSSAPYVARVFAKVALFKPLGPLTGAEDEWGEPFSRDGTRQNKRCGHVFMRADGTAYDGQGRIFRDANGCCYTSKDSHVDVTFPYTPKSEYVDVKDEEDTTQDT